MSLSLAHKSVYRIDEMRYAFFLTRSICMILFYRPNRGSPFGFFYHHYTYFIIDNTSKICYNLIKSIMTHCVDPKCKHNIYCAYVLCLCIVFI